MPSDNSPGSDTNCRSSSGCSRKRRGDGFTHEHNVARHCRAPRSGGPAIHIDGRGYGFRGHAPSAHPAMTRRARFGAAITRFLSDCSNFPSPNARNLAKLVVDRTAPALTLSVWPLCSRNLWEARRLACVILLPNSLSPSYPGAPPGVADCHPTTSGAHGASWGPFLFPQRQKEPLATARSGQKTMSEKSHDPNKMTGAAMIVRALIDHGVKHLFGYPGGAVLPIYDEIFQQSEVEHMLVRHEQGAGHAAEGYARSTGKPGVVLVTSGPGATNMVTPLTDALMDSIPLVCITGQVPTHLIGNDAFQECDTVGITRPCTKHNWLVRDVNDLAKVLHEAFYVATTGRPGPVLVDVPKDVQFATGTYHPPRKSDVHRSYAPRVKGDATQIRKAVSLLAGAKRPVIYSGGGVINSGPEASKLLRELVEVTGFPITSTLMGLGAYPASGKNWLGMLGMHGTYEANMSMHDCDVMLCVGARFDDRITGRVDAFSPNSKKIHIDID